MASAEKTVIDIFKRFDANGDGMISPEELRVVLRSIGDFTDEKADTIFNECDASRDGMIDVDEFVAWIYGDEEAPVSLGFLAMKGDIDKARRLVQMGASVNSYLESASPLLIAILFGHDEFAAFLIEARADPEMCTHDAHRCTPLRSAAEEGNMKVVQKLIAAGACLDSKYCKDRRTACRVAELQAKVHSKKENPERAAIFNEIAELLRPQAHPRPGHSYCVTPKFIIQRESCFPSWLAKSGLQPYQKLTEDQMDHLSNYFDDETGEGLDDFIDQDEVQDMATIDELAEIDAMLHQLLLECCGPTEELWRFPWLRSHVEEHGDREGIYEVPGSKGVVVAARKMDGAGIVLQWTVTCIVIVNKTATKYELTLKDGKNLVSSETWKGAVWD